MDETAFPYRQLGSLLTGKVALVTGAAKGIGLGCARVIGSAGAAIAALDIDQSALDAAVQELTAEGISVQGFVTDVGHAQSVTDVMQDIVDRYGCIDILVNNAGTHDGKSIENASEEDWDRIIATNLKSMFLMTKAALPYLKEARGSIVNMGSMVGLVGQANSGAYSASKGGIIALTRNMALDFAPYGIRVNCICPGWVETPLVNAWFQLQQDEVESRRYVNSIHPLGRIASPEEIGQVALFLASAQASFVTGVSIPVDGGVTLGY